LTNPSLAQLQQSIQRLLGTEQPCTCGRTHAVPIRQVLVEQGAIEQVPEVLARLGLAGQCLLVADPTTYEVAGGQVRSVIEQDGRSVDTLVLPPTAEQQHLEATDEAAEEVRRQASGTDHLIAVGSGTINDIVKLAATRLHIPYVAVATAPSMTGYSSALAAVLSGGIKQALPAQPPVAIVADLEILAAAPSIMIAAGVGDLISRSLSSADWQMSSLLVGTYFCQVPVSVIAEADEDCRDHVAQIGQADPEAIAVLTAGLILAGMSITMAQTSSPGSGGGHLISHYWDMTAPARGRQQALHGCQVAVGDLVCFTLYERLRLCLDEADVDQVIANRPDGDEISAVVVGHFAPLIGRGPTVSLATVAAEKHGNDEGLYRRLEVITEDSGAFWAQLDPLLTPSTEARRLLRAAGVPTTIKQLDVAPDELINAFRYARYIRGRYTVLDLAYDLGLLEELQDEVLSNSGVLL